MYEHNFKDFEEVAAYYNTRKHKEGDASWVYFLSIDNETKIGHTRQNPVKRWRQLGVWGDYLLPDLKFAAYNCQKWGINRGEFERAIHKKLKHHKKYNWQSGYGYLGPISLYSGYTEVFTISIEDATKAAYELLEVNGLTSPKQLEFSF
jgi:hypothetical protein